MDSKRDYTYSFCRDNLNDIHILLSEHLGRKVWKKDVAEVIGVCSTTMNKPEWKVRLKHLIAAANHFRVAVDIFFVHKGETRGRKLRSVGENDVYVVDFPFVKQRIREFCSRGGSMEDVRGALGVMNNVSEYWRKLPGEGKNWQESSITAEEFACLCNLLGMPPEEVVTLKNMAMNPDPLHLERTIRKLEEENSMLKDVHESDIRRMDAIAKMNKKYEDIISVQKEKILLMENIIENNGLEVPGERGER